MLPPPLWMLSPVQKGEESSGKGEDRPAGCGSVSQRGLLPHLSQDDIKDRGELAAVMDVVAERAEATATKFGARLWFDDYDEMLASDIDAVVIASPIGYHYEQGMKAIRAGKHVHFNKTMTTTRAEADEIIRAAQDARADAVAREPDSQAPGRRGGHRQGVLRRPGPFLDRPRI